MLNAGVNFTVFGVKAAFQFCLQRNAQLYLLVCEQMTYSNLCQLLCLTRYALGTQLKSHDRPKVFWNIQGSRVSIKHTVQAKRI